MRLNHLDILEQCFRDKLRGYSKQEVDTFLHLVADDFKEMTEEIELLTKKLAHKEKIIKELQETREKLEENKKAVSEPPAKTLEEIKQLKKQVAEKDQLIRELKETQKANRNDGGQTQITPEMLKEKARRIINVARDHADQFTQKAEQKLSSLKQDISKLQLEKKNLLEVIKNTAQNHLEKLGKKPGTRDADHVSKDKKM